MTSLYVIFWLVFFLVLFFAMFGAGIIGLISTPRQEDPQISVPLIDVFRDINVFVFFHQFLSVKMVF
jgi:multidrug efflux pump subunit AcrB